MNTTKKKAYLVMGVISKDTVAMAQQLKVNLEANITEYYHCISENKLLSEYVEMNGFHPFCLKEWKAPIFNKFIIHLLEITEEAMNNNNSAGVIIDGSFALDKDVKQVCTEILEEQGYQVIVIPVESNMMEIIQHSITTGESIKSLYLNWKKYNQHFVRIYSPITDLPSAVVINGELNDPILTEIVPSLAINNKIIVIDKEKDVNHFYHTDCVMIAKDKQDIFWTKIAYHYNVKLVIDNDPYAIFEWHKINVPVMMLLR